MIIVGIIAGFLTMFLNYCIGKPGSKEFSPYEIFSSYTVWLSKMRLKRLGLFDDYSSQYHDNLKRIGTKAGLLTLNSDFKKIYYNAAEPYFTWERAFGMCPVCFGVWVSLASGIFYLTLINPEKGSLHFILIFVHLLTIIVTSHIVIRLLSKII